MKDVIYSINGPVVTVKDTSTFGMAEMVYVGNAGLIGEVISVSEARTTIQVYENTTGLLVGEPVKGTGAPLSATLGPGIMEKTARSSPRASMWTAWIWPAGGM